MASSGVGRRPGRPRSLTREEVARAALAEGLSRFSMPTVARRLGVSHSTLYRYVHDRDDLLLAAMDLAVRDFDWPAPSVDWRETLTGFADALWGFLDRHPGIAESTFAVPGTPRAVAEQFGRYVVSLRAAGLTTEDAVLALDFVLDLTISSAVMVAGMGQVRQTADGPRTLADLHRQSWPELAELVPGPAGEQMWTSRGWFDRKLELLLDGLSLRVPR